jgi:ABC-type uncharacterized transport system substrate-binding protein
MRRTFSAAMIGFLLLLLPAGAGAHPHIFLETSVGVEISSGRLEGLRVRWEWDPWLSEDIILQCDTNADGRFDASETECVRRNFFEDAWEIGYFTTILVDGRKIPFERAREFTARVMQPDGMVVFDFLLPFARPLPARGKVEILFNDDTIFTAFDDFVGTIGDISAIKGFTSGIYEDFGVRISFSL